MWTTKGSKDRGWGWRARLSPGRGGEALTAGGTDETVLWLWCGWCLPPPSCGGAARPGMERKQQTVLFLGKKSRKTFLFIYLAPNEDISLEKILRKKQKKRKQKIKLAQKQKRARVFLGW
jgi:hypothetical protein